MNKNTYYSLVKEGTEATIHIFGNITSWPWKDSDVSSHNLSQQLEELGDVEHITVCINSYGGEVAEGLAIYNTLRNHKAKVTTINAGFACSIASVIFMAGDERIMNESSMLMIHNAWTYASGNAKELRKQAEDLDKITQASVEAYKSHSNLEEEEIKNLMDYETFISPTEAIEYGFATSINKVVNSYANQSALGTITNIVKEHQQQEANPQVGNEPITKKEEKPVPQPNEEVTTEQLLGGFFNGILNKKRGM